jgi:putative Mn2+ efflux pump MntP
MLSTILIGLSLSMDAFAISVSSGISIPNLKPFHAFRAALFFGLSQFLMPVAGWFLGNTFAAAIGAWDHWIAFGLLAFIGGKMLWEAVRARESRAPGGARDTAAASSPGTNPDKPGIQNLGALTLLALATSIDAMAVGLSFSILNREIWLPAAVIGLVTLGVCLTGFEAGRRVGLIFGRGAQIAGGLILLGIGVKILAEHLFIIT